MSTLQRDTWADDRIIRDSAGHAVTVWSYKPEPGEHIRARSLGCGTHFSGTSPGNVALFADAVDRYGHAILRGTDRPGHHYVAGCGVGHDDAEFAETGTSMAAYYDSGEAFGGPWWEDKSRYGSRKYYRDPLGRIPATRTRDGRPVR